MANFTIIDTLFKNKWIKSHPKRDSRRKSLFKAISWRFIGTIDTVLLSWIVTGRFKIALSIGLLEVITKTILYYFHERVWASIDVASYEEIEGKIKTF